MYQILLNIVKNNLYFINIVCIFYIIVIIVTYRKSPTIPV